MLFVLAPIRVQQIHRRAPHIHSPSRSPISHDPPPVFPILPRRSATSHENRTPRKNTPPDCSPAPAHAVAPTSTYRACTRQTPLALHGPAPRNPDPANAPSIQAP